MRGDLDHAIAVASYQVRLATLMRWNVIPITIFVLFGMWEAGKPVWIAACIFIFFLLTLLASGWENNIYKSRKQELETLRDKLDNEPVENKPR